MNGIEWYVNCIISESFHSVKTLCLKDKVIMLGWQGTFPPCLVVFPPSCQGSFLFTYIYNLYHATINTDVNKFTWILFLMAIGMYIYGNQKGLVRLWLLDLPQVTGQACPDCFSILDLMEWNVELKKEFARNTMQSAILLDFSYYNLFIHHFKHGHTCTALLPQPLTTILP